MTSLTKKPHSPSEKDFFRVQTRRLAASWDFYRVCRAYWAREIPVQSHVRLVVFFQKSPKAAGRQRVKKDILALQVELDWYVGQYGYVANITCWQNLIDIYQHYMLIKTAALLSVWSVRKPKLLLRLWLVNTNSLSCFLWCTVSSSAKYTHHCTIVSNDSNVNFVAAFCKISKWLLVNKSCYICLTMEYFNYWINAWKFY